MHRHICPKTLDHYGSFTFVVKLVGDLKLSPKHLAVFLIPEKNTSRQPSLPDFTEQLQSKHFITLHDKTKQCNN